MDKRQVQIGALDTIDMDGVYVDWVWWVGLHQNVGMYAKVFGQKVFKFNSKRRKQINKFVEPLTESK